MVRTNQEIYNQAKREAANIMSYEQIALNAMFILRKEMERHYEPEPEDDDEEGEVITVPVQQVNFFR